MAAQSVNVQAFAVGGFVRDQILNFSYDNAELTNYMSNVIDAVCYDIIFQSNYQSILAALSFSEASSTISPTELADLLQQESIRPCILPTHRS